MPHMELLLMITNAQLQGACSNLTGQPQNQSTSNQLHADHAGFLTLFVREAWPKVSSLLCRCKLKKPDCDISELRPCDPLRQEDERYERELKREVKLQMTSGFRFTYL